MIETCIDPGTADELEQGCEEKVGERGGQVHGCDKLRRAFTRGSELLNGKKVEC